VVTDIRMKELDPLKFLLNIKGENSESEVIFISSKDDTDLAIKSLRHGASDFIFKPVEKEALITALKRACDKISSRREITELRKNADELALKKSTELVTEERIAAVSQLVEGMGEFISDIADDMGSDTIYLNEMPCFVSVHNRDLKVVATNDFYKERLGDKIGHNSWEVYLGKAADRDECPVGKTFKAGRNQKSNELVECVSGYERPVITHTAPIRDRNNEVDLVLEMSADIRAIKYLKEELRTTQQRYQQIFDDAPCYIYIQDREYRLTEINRRFREDFGEETGSHCYKVYKRRTEPCPNCPLAKTYMDGELHQAEMVMTSKTGEKINVLLWTAPITNAIGKITHVMVMATNTTEIHELQDHLSSLGLMIGSISHGVKGLLTGLDAGMYKLDSGFSKDNQEEIEEGLEVTQLVVSRIRSLMLDILYYAKERELKWERVDVLSFADEVAATVGLKIRSQGIHFRRDFDEALGEFEVDTGVVHSALINILENALDACLEDKSGKSHTIIFSGSRDGDNIIFDIHDNGLGMDSETQKNMFNIFFSSKETKGTGLGLFISNKIIQQHGGSIKVKSEPGRGSHFRITLPKTTPLSITSKSAPGKEK